MYGSGDSYSITEVLELVLRDLREEESKAREVRDNTVTGILLAKKIVKKHIDNNYG